MYKVKIFTSGSARQVEADMNAWLKDQPDLIISNILQGESVSGDDWNLTITILYEVS